MRRKHGLKLLLACAAIDGQVRADSDSADVVLRPVLLAAPSPTSTVPDIDSVPGQLESVRRGDFFVLELWGNRTSYGMCGALGVISWPLLLLDSLGLMSGAARGRGKSRPGSTTSS